MRRQKRLLIRQPVKRNIEAFPKFRWLGSREDGRWVCGMGPQARYPAGGVINGNDALALMLGDAEWLRKCGLQWFDSQSRAADWQSRWRRDWPIWLWPEDSRPCSDLVLELASAAGVAPRLANNAPEYDWVRNCWRKRRVAKEPSAYTVEMRRSISRQQQPQQLTLVLGVGLKKVRR